MHRRICILSWDAILVRSISVASGTYIKKMEVLSGGARFLYEVLTLEE